MPFDIRLSFMKEKRDRSVLTGAALELYERILSLRESIGEYNDLEPEAAEMVRQIREEMGAKGYFIPVKDKSNIDWKGICLRAVENLSLYFCKKCHNLSMIGWTCPECGYDDSD